MSQMMTYQRKDVLLKILIENYRNKSLNAYGLNLPPIKEVLPTNLSVSGLNEKCADNIFLLEDDTILILGYESVTDNQNILKYGHYAFRAAETYFCEKLNKVIIAVIYSGDIEKAPECIDLGRIKLYLEQVFLSKFNGNEFYDYLKTKIEDKELLTDEDVMRFIILPLTQKDNRQESIEKALSLAQKITDEDIQGFVIAGILTVINNFIDENYSEKLKEWLKMTKVGILFEEEKIEYANKYAKEYVQRETLKIARSLFSKGVDILIIMEVTMLSESEILGTQN